MTYFEPGFPPWDLFQARIKLAISRAAAKHETVGNLLIDLELCEMLLRVSEESVGDLGSPVALELEAALDAHAANDPFRYDEICAANVVLAVMNAIAKAAAETDS
jgi:hypothetical protein